MPTRLRRHSLMQPIMTTIYHLQICCYTGHTAEQLLAVQRVVWVLCLGAQALLIVAIVQRKLFRAYPFFLAYLAIDMACSLALLQIPYRTLAYAAAFRVYRSFDTIVQLGMAGEAFQHLCWHFRQFPGFGRFRFLMAIALLALTGVLFLAVFPGIPATYPHLMVVWIERWETSVLAITLALSWWVLTRFLGLRPQMRSNALVHVRMLIVFFAINAAGESLSLIARKVTAVLMVIPAANVGMLSGTLACYAAWIVYLRRDGEQLLPEPPVSPEALAYSRVWRRSILEYVQQAGRKNR